MDYDRERDAAFISISKRIADEVSIGYRLTFLDFDREGDSHGKVKPNNKELIDWFNRGNPGTVADFNTVIRFESDTELDNTLDHTFGLLWCISEEWQLGLELGYLRGDFEKTEKTILHGNPQPTIDFDGDLERLRVRAGVAFDVTERSLLAVDVEYQDAEWNYDSYEKPLGTGTFRDAAEDRSDFSIHAGAEHELNDWLTLRGGLQYTWISYDNDFAERPYDLDVDYPGFFAGFGIAYRRIEIDYSLGYENAGDGDWNTSAGVTVRF
jgi:opacity protein-like surface antigen